MEDNYELVGLAQDLAGQSSAGALGTLDKQGYPHTSLVEIHWDGTNFWLLLSDLATHSRHLKGDGRASIMVHADQRSSEEGLLAGARGTFVGEARVVEEVPRGVREAYLKRHPRAVKYVDFGDFRFYRLVVERARIIAGFGAMGWLKAEDLGANIG